MKKTFEGPIKAAGAPYSPVVERDGLLFISGQVPLDPATKQIVPGGIEEQTRQALSNLTGALAAAGLTPADVLKTTVFLTDMGHYAAMNAIYAESFSEAPPARSAVAVAALPFGCLVEIEAVAGR